MLATTCSSQSHEPIPTFVALPGDVEQCHQIIRSTTELLLAKETLLREKEELIHALSADLKLTKEQVDYLMRKLFGRRSEKMVLAEGQLSLFDELKNDEASAEEIDGAKADEPAEEATEVRSHKRRGRKPLPADLPRVRVVHDLTEEDKCCPNCSETRTIIGEEITEQLEYVPASLHVIEHVQLKYACLPCKGNVTLADKPAQPIEKSIAASGMLAYVITSKYCDHLPLHRQEAILARHGAELSRKTLCDWVMQSAAVLEPVVVRMKEKILSGGVLNTDDTPVPTQNPPHKKDAQNPPNKGSTHRSYLWVYVGHKEEPFTVYDFTWTREGKGPRDFLGKFQGYLQADAFGGYDALFKPPKEDSAAPPSIVEVGCWAHARRKFYDARHSDGARAHEALNRIRALYRIERRAKEANLDARATRALRQEEAKPILEKLFEWMASEQMAVLPKSPLGQAMAYALSNKKALSRYLEIGELAIDNNVAERALRKICVGRNNWLFAGSARGGRAAAIHYSLIESARRHGHDPFAYLRDLLTRIATHPHKDLDALLPDRWKPAQPQA